MSSEQPFETPDAAATPQAPPPPSEPATDEFARVLEENEQLKAALEQRQARSHRLLTARRVLVGILVVLSCLAVVLAGIAWWTHQTLLDTDEFMEIATPLAQEPEVQQAVSVYTTDQIMAGLDIESRITNALPEEAEILGPPITRAVHDFTQARLLEFTQTQTFQDLWTQSFRLAHEGSVRVLRDEAPNVSVVNGEVRLNLMPLLATGLERVADEAAGLFEADVDLDLAARPGVQDPEVLRQRLESAYGVVLPEDFGTVRLMSEDELASLQDGVTLFDRLVYALFALAIVLIVVTLLLSRNRRRTLVQIGLGLVVSLLLLRVATGRLQTMVIDSIADPTGRGAARAGVQTVVENLRVLGNWLLVVGLLIAVIAYFLGRPSWVVAAVDWLRRVTAPQVGGSELEQFVAARYDWLRVGGVAFATVVLLWVGLGWLSVLLLAAFVTAWLFGLQALRARAVPRALEGEASPG